MAILLPPGFRREGGDDLVDVFRDGLRVARARGAGARLAFWVRTLADLVLTAVREWLAAAADRVAGLRVLGRTPLREIELAARRLRRTPGHALLAVGTVAMGLGAVVTVFSVVQGVLLRPLPLEEPRRLVRLLEDDLDGRAYWPSYPSFVDWREGATGVESMTAFSSPDVRPVGLGDAAVRLSVAGAGLDFLSTLGAVPVRGRDFTAAENRPGGPPAVLVAHAFWQDALGGAPLEELSVRLGGERQPVVGVLPPGFRIFDAVDLWTPLERREDLGDRGSHGYHVIARLEPGVGLDDARARLARLAAGLKETYGDDTHAATIRLTPLHDTLVGEVEGPLMLLLGAAGLVFTVACLNLAGALLARGMARSRELAVRLALGARRADLVRHLVAEAAVLAVPGAVGGILLAMASLAHLRRLGSGIVPRLHEVGVDAPVLATATGLAVATALVAGIVPALALARRDVADRLRGRGSAAVDTRESRRLWAVFLAVQVALTLVLLAGSGLLLRSLTSALAVDLGYRTEGILAVDVTLPEDRYPDGDTMIGFHERALAGLEDLGEVAAVGLTSVQPHVSQARIGMVGPEGADETFVWAGYRLVDAGFFEVLDIPVAGATVPAPADPEAPLAVTLSEDLEERLWQGDATGRRLRASFARPPGGMRVAGRAGATREWWQQPGDLGTVYMHYRASGDALRAMHLLVRGVPGADPGDLAASVRSALGRVDPQVPVDIEPLEDRVAASLADRRLTLDVVAGFATTAILLAALAVFGAVSYGVARRQREVGVRLVLGAGRADVMRTVARGGLAPVIAGILLGAAAALALGPVLEAWLFAVSSRDPVVLAGAALLLLAAAVVAAAVPARRAARVDPAETLRLGG